MLFFKKLLTLSRIFPAFEQTASFIIKERFHSELQKYQTIQGVSAGLKQIMKYNLKLYKIYF